MEKIRCKNIVFKRDTPRDDWEELTFTSINAAKKYNGLDSKTIQHRRQLPQPLPRNAEGQA